ncbi:MAG TPA: hypothetical protein VMU85_06140 [Stellaceae bacterium]|nr:hypothetical protein [Stellaceae bacterium]
MMVVNWSVLTLLSGLASFAVVYGVAGLPGETGRDIGGAVGLGELEARTTCAVTDYRTSEAGYELLLGGHWVLIGDEGAFDRIPHAGGHAIVCTRPHTDRRSVSL